MGTLCDAGQLAGCVPDARCGRSGRAGGSRRTHVQQGESAAPGDAPRRRACACALLARTADGSRSVDAGGGARAARRGAASAQKFRKIYVGRADRARGPCRWRRRRWRGRAGRRWWWSGRESGGAPVPGWCVCMQRGVLLPRRAPPRGVGARGAAAGIGSLIDLKYKINVIFLGGGCNYRSAGACSGNRRWRPRTRCGSVRIFLRARGDTLGQPSASPRNASRFSRETHLGTTTRPRVAPRHTHIANIQYTISRALFVSDTQYRGQRCACGPHAIARKKTVLCSEAQIKPTLEPPRLRLTVWPGSTDRGTHGHPSVCTSHRRHCRRRHLVARGLSLAPLASLRLL